MTILTIQRRYDIDWLRTLAFFILILYHISMYYVQDWGWHIKSEHTFRWLQEVMMLTNTWRMSLLFFISAMAMSLIEQRYSISRLSGIRSNRLLIPLLFGMFVIVAPQVYIEALSQDLIPPGFMSFWLQYMNPNTELLKGHQSVIGLLTWNHLWFLPYLWVYSLLVLICRRLITKCINSHFVQNMPFLVGFTLLVSILLWCYLSLRIAYPGTNALVDDWYNHGKYFTVFVFGYLFAQQTNWWQGVITLRRVWAILALLGYAFIVADRNDMFTWLATQYQTSIWVRAFYGVIFIINIWAWIFALVGYAGRYLREGNRMLSYANHAVLPWYMLHQTLIVIAAWYLKPAQLAAPLEFFSILFFTVCGCVLGYELARRVFGLRWLFGIKSQAR